MQVTFVVADPAALLDPGSYDAGALLRVESASADTGPWTEFATTALDAGITLYAVWDAAGTVGTWYRRRFSDAGGTLFSAYSDAFQVDTVSPLLTVAELRLQISSALTDPALQLLLDAAAQAIIAEVGASEDVSEFIAAHGDLLLLSQPASAITSVIERSGWSDVALDATDYELRASGQTLRRLWTGINPSRRWRGRIDVPYSPLADEATRKVVQLELVKLELGSTAGVGVLASQRLGDWSESYQSSAPTYAQQRADILASLHGSAVLIR